MAGIHLYDVIVRPVVTEKTNAMAADNCHYTFEVDMRANKHMVRSAVETIFCVHVVAVNMITMHGKKRRFGRHEAQLKDWKKAIVTLSPGETISFFEGV